MAVQTETEAQTTVQVQPNLLQRAKQNDSEAIATMFRQFLPEDEHVMLAEYLGVLGVWGIGTHSFAAVTDRRVAGMRVQILGGVTYQDGFLEYLNSGMVHQPSKLLLYIYVAIISVVTLGIGLLLLPLTVRIYYRFHKCGLVLWVREGVPVYVFSDRKRVGVANNLYREAAYLRGELLATGIRPEIAPTSGASGSSSVAPQRRAGRGGCPRRRDRRLLSHLHVWSASLGARDLGGGGRRHPPSRDRAGVQDGDGHRRRLRAGRRGGHRRCAHDAGHDAADRPHDEGCPYDDSCPHDHDDLAEDLPFHHHERLRVRAGLHRRCPHRAGYDVPHERHCP